MVSNGNYGDEGTLVTALPLMNGEPIISSTTLDKSVQPRSDRTGLLWLDVEGFAFRVLNGAGRTLDNILVAKIEVEFADMNLYRSKNFSRISNLMSRKGFILIKCNLNPCYFGDLLFVHKSNLRTEIKLKGILLRFMSMIVHNFFYKIMGKPGY